MWRFVSTKTLFRDYSEFNSRLVEHRAQISVRKFKMLAFWISIAEGFPTARSRALTILRVYLGLCYLQNNPINMGETVRKVSKPGC